ncbi:MAG: galE [Bacteroidetes bacterium]|nr:MAG: galE [Bacteroidota bacterium]
MHIIITGVAGFIGSNLATRLLKENHEVTGFDNFSFGSPANISALRQNPRFHFIEADVRDADTLESVSGDVLVHLASQKIPRYSTAFRTLDDNARMLKNAIVCCRTKKMKLVFASTSDVYGKNPDLPYSEESDLVMGPTTVKRWAYALSKIYSEHSIIAHHDEFGLEYTIMRFFGSYGPNQNITWWGGPQSVFIQNILEGKPIEIHGDGLQTRTFTYVDDTVQGVMKCIFHEKSRNGIFNIAGKPDEEITILDLGRLIWKLMKGDTAAPISFIPYETFGKYEDVRRRVPSIGKIKTELGFEPGFHLAEGLQETIRWQTGLSEK